MTLPLVSTSKKKKKKPSLLLVLSSAVLLIGGGVAAYWLFTQGKLFHRDLPPGANIIPQDTLFAVSLTTDDEQWQKLREFGSQKTQAQLEQNLVQLRDRFLNNNGYDFQKDIRPWVGDAATIAILAPETPKTSSKPVATDVVPSTNEQSMVMILPIKDQQKAQSILTQSQALKDGKWADKIYNGIDIKETNLKSGQKLSVALVDQNYLVVTDDASTTQRVIKAYKDKVTLATIPGFADNFPKVSSFQPFAQFYVNVPAAAKIATAADNQHLPAQVLSQLQNDQGLAGTVNLESDGIRFKGVSWLNPNSQRVLTVDNNAGKMQNRLPADTLMMLSGENLQRLWADYVSTSTGNPLSPLPPEKLRSNVKSLTNLDLDRDLLSWMGGEFSLSLIPTTPKQGSTEDSRLAFVFMIQTSDRDKAESSLKQLDEVMKTQNQFQIQQATVGDKPIVNWIGPLGTLFATHGWLNDNVAFLAIGAPIADKILPEPNQTLANSASFQSTVPSEPNPTNGQFYLNVERVLKGSPLLTLSPEQQPLLEATRSIGVTSTTSDNRSMVYNVFVALKKDNKSK